MNSMKVLDWRLALLLAGCSIVAAPAVAEKQEWVALDSSPAGTPADIQLDRRGSNPTRTAVDIYVHGFYVESKLGPDGEYSQITVPGLGTISQTGAPSLPAARLRLALVTGAENSRTVQKQDGVKNFEGIMVWPQPIPETDDRTNDRTGSPEVFQKDEKIYSSKGSWPPSPIAPSVPPSLQLGSIKGLSTEFYPLRWDPSSKTLSVAAHTRLTISHPGKPVRQKAITKERFAMAKSRFVNWDIVGSFIPPNKLFYEGDFLFIYPDGYQTALAPLVNQKKARGFAVTQMTTTTTGNTCASIRAAIQTWYNGRPSWRDKYALLVGDVDQIPFCTAPNGAPTDDLYASTNGDDLDAEIYLGRLSVDSTTDATDQVTKILQYEDHPSLFCCYDQALLVAHKEGAPGKYEGAHESVRTASYSVPPVFSTIYGSQAGSDNASVTAAIDHGTGVVAYRGHGSETEWWSWNQLNESYENADMSGLANSLAQTPIMWSFACTNSDLNTEDSIAEVAMETATQRAVSYYGASEPSDTTPNHELDRQMFKSVYDLGMTTQSQAIQYAEHQMAAMTWDSNSWRYLLLGDPEMQIRRRNPLNLVLKVPEAMRICKIGPCFLDLSVFDEKGNPVPDVVVSAWKSGRRGDEVLVNQYSNADGSVRLTASPKSVGVLKVTANTRLGDTASMAIKVQE